MPDPIIILTASVVSATTAAVLWLVLRLFWRAPPRLGAARAWVLSVGPAFYVGSAMLNLWPRWPLREDQDRLLVIVMPAVLVTELLAALASEPIVAWPRLPSWCGGLLRAAVVCGTAPVLLFGSRYVADLSGPASRAWSTWQMLLIFAGLAALLAAVWWALVSLGRKDTGWSLPVSLAGVCAAAGLTVMLSGYATGGQFGLAMAAALSGGALAALLLRSTIPSADPTAALGIGMVLLFSVLVIGRFFAELTTTHALLLFAAPLLSWLPELPGVRHRLPAWLVRPTRVACVALLAIGVLVSAQQAFVRNSQAPGGADGSGLDDYMSFGN